jgi:hypothetical protein
MLGSIDINVHGSIYVTVKYSGRVALAPQCAVIVGAKCAPGRTWQPDIAPIAGPGLQAQISRQRKSDEARTRNQLHCCAVLHVDISDHKHCIIHSVLGMPRHTATLMPCVRGLRALLRTIDPSCSGYQSHLSISILATRCRPLRSR